MRIKHLHIERFRSIESIDLDLGDTTVLIGPNNAGKTAILEAIRIALTRRWGQRGTGFTEYDVHLQDETSDPKKSDPVLIEIELAEEAVGEWPEDLQSDLVDIIQIDPVDGRSSILLRVSCKWDDPAGSYVPKWEFLNVQRAALAGKGARAVNFQEFFQFLPVFYLAALRDADDEFSNRSQFWGRLLRSVQIPEALERKSKRVFDLLNRELLKADPRLAKLATTLSDVSRIAAGDQPGGADLRLTPMRSSDLLSRAEIIYRSETDKPWLPLARHGQGIQSLSVMFLFRGFVEQLLKELFKPDSVPILALEEPETHLHPQAARTLWKHVNELPGQKIVTSHSPYFLQHVPFRDLRIVRLDANGTSIASLPSSFRGRIPHDPGLAPIIANSRGLLSYDRSLNELVIHGSLDSSHYRKLLTVFGRHPDTAAIQVELKRVMDQSSLFVSDEELAQLETFARRIRGEIFFARRWVLVEGPSEYHVLHGLGAGLGYDLDEHGVSVIDFKNNGNPTCFVALARALRIPWLVVVDGDLAGHEYLRQIKDRGVSTSEMTQRCAFHPAGTLEQQLVADGLQGELKSLLSNLGHSDAATLSDSDLVDRLKKEKASFTAMLGHQCSIDPALSARMPMTLRNAIQSLRGLT